MNKEDLIKNISTQTNMTKKEVDLILTTSLELIMDTVARGETVRLVGFGSFHRHRRNKRIGSNPKNGISIEIPSSNTAKFSAGKFFKQRVNIME